MEGINPVCHSSDSEVCSEDGVELSLPESAARQGWEPLNRSKDGRRSNGGCDGSPGDCDTF